MIETFIRVAPEKRVFLVEDDPERIAWFKRKLLTTLEFQTDDPIMACIELDIQEAQNNQYDLFFLDHDLGGPMRPPYATEVAKKIRELNIDASKVVIHSWNPVGALNLQRILPGSSRHPFGSFNIHLSRPECQRCHVGFDDDGDGNCAYCTGKADEELCSMSSKAFQSAALTTFQRED